jgi:hypothetical protein
MANDRDLAEVDDDLHARLHDAYVPAREGGYADLSATANTGRDALLSMV